MAKQFLEAGKIVNTHGIHGDLRVQSWCDTPEVLCDFDTLYFDENTPVKVLRAAVHKGDIVIMRLEGVNSINEAEKLKNKLLFLDRDDAELPEDLVFIQDIISFEVFDVRTQQTVGIIRDVLTTNPAHDMYEIKSENGQLFYIPAAKPFLKEVDLEKGIIYIETIEGLIP